MFEKMYFDPFFEQSLVRIAAQEGLVNSNTDIHEAAAILRPKRNILKSKTLLMLTLFEETDACHWGTNLDLKKLEDLGLVLPAESSYLHMEPNISSNKADDEALQMTHLIMNHFKEDFLRQHLLGVPASYYDTRCANPYRFRPHPNPTKEMLIEASHLDYGEMYDWGRTSKQELSELYTRTLEQVFSEISDEYPDPTESDGYRILHNSFLRRDIRSYVNKLSLALGGAMYEGAQVASGLSCPVQPGRYESESLDHLMCIAQATLKDEMKILPEPKNLKHAAELRRTPQIGRLREVVSEWVQTIQEGRVDAEKKIRGDITKANKELRQLDSWREYKNSNFAFWINAIGGHIPVFSNVLTVVSTFGDKAFTHTVEKRSGWALLLR